MAQGGKSIVNSAVASALALFLWASGIGAAEAATEPPQTTYYLVVHGSATAGKDAEYNTWYLQHHLPDMLALPGVISGQRFVLAEDQDRVFDPKTQKYMIIFKIRTNNLKAVFRELERRSKAKLIVMSPAFDGSTVTSAAFVPLGPEVFATESAKKRAAAAVAATGVQ